MSYTIKIIENETSDNEKEIFSNTLFNIKNIELIIKLIDRLADLETDITIAKNE